MMQPGSGREWPPRPHNERPPGPPAQDPRHPYPDVRSAFMLTLYAMLAAAFTGVLFIDFGLLAAVGVGQAIGVGAVATVAAKRVAEPQSARIGLRSIDLAALPTILCLAPAILLASELDNFARDWSGSDSTVDGSIEAWKDGGEDAGPGDDGTLYDYERRYDALDSQGTAAQQAVPLEEAAANEAPVAESTGEVEEPSVPLFDPNDPISLLQAFIVMVGISPIVEEFLFRGVIQQGLVARLGMLRGVTVVALLWTLLRPAPIAGFARFVAAALASFALGWLLGVVRIATRSILGPILLAALWGAVGLASLALEGELDLPGMNVDETHLPWSVTLASLGLVGWAGLTVFREAERAFAEDPLATGGSSGDGSGEADLASVSDPMAREETEAEVDVADSPDDQTPGSR